MRSGVVSSRFAQHDVMNAEEWWCMDRVVEGGTEAPETGALYEWDAIALLVLG